MISKRSRRVAIAKARIEEETLAIRTKERVKIGSQEAKFIAGENKGKLLVEVVTEKILEAKLKKEREKELDK